MKRSRIFALVSLFTLLMVIRYWLFAMQPTTVRRRVPDKPETVRERIQGEANWVDVGEPGCPNWKYRVAP